MDVRKIQEEQLALLSEVKINHEDMDYLEGNVDDPSSPPVCPLKNLVIIPDKRNLEFWKGIDEDDLSGGRLVCKPQNDNPAPEHLVSWGEKPAGKKVLFPMTFIHTHDARYYEGNRAKSEPVCFSRDGSTPNKFIYSSSCRPNACPKRQDQAPGDPWCQYTPVAYFIGPDGVPMRMSFRGKRVGFLLKKPDGIRASLKNCANTWDKTFIVKTSNQEFERKNGEKYSMWVMEIICEVTTPPNIVSLAEHANQTLGEYFSEVKEFDKQAHQREIEELKRRKEIEERHRELERLRSELDNPYSHTESSQGSPPEEEQKWDENGYPEDPPF